MSLQHQAATAKQPPPSLRPWRCKAGPGLPGLSDVESSFSSAGAARSMRPASPSPPATKMHSDGQRRRHVKLAGLAAVPGIAPHRVELPRLPDAGQPGLARVNSDGGPFLPQEPLAGAPALHQKWSMSLPPGQPLSRSARAAARPGSGGPPRGGRGPGPGGCGAGGGAKAWPLAAQEEVERLREALDEREGALSQALQRAQQLEELNKALVVELAACQSAARLEHEALASELAACRSAAMAELQEARQAAALARVRARSGGAGLAAAVLAAGLHATFAAWRTAASDRKASASLQARLFAEEASRGAALRAQKIDLDIRYMEAEVRHRGVAHKLRSELAEAEVRSADTLARQEATSAQQLAAAESDFLAALREAVGDPAQAQRPEPGGAGGEAADGAGGAPEGSGAGGEEADARLARAVASVRRRAETQLREAEERGAAALQAERERAERQQLLLERRHQEALQAARDAGERRLQAAEARHAEEMGLLPREEHSGEDRRDCSADDAASEPATSETW